MVVSNSLAKLDRATQMLAEVRSVDDAVKIIDLAEAARVYAQQVKLGLEAQNHAAEIKLRAQRKAGEILADMDKAKGAAVPGWNKTVLPNETPFDQPKTYDEIGITRKDAHVWQTIAALPEEKFEQIVEETKSEDRELSTAALYRESRQEINKQQNEEIIQNGIDMRVPDGKYRTIVIDPPWHMEKILREVAPNQVGFEYPTMTTEQIKEFPIPAEVADDDCHLFMWTTQKYLPAAFDILQAWGFRYVFTMVWHKNGGFQPFNLPQYNCEFVLYGRKGSPEFTDTKAFPTCFDGERREHSRKPDEFYDLIERVAPGPRIDIFSREKREGFDQYGNEPEKFLGV